MLYRTWSLLKTAHFGTLSINGSTEKANFWVLDQHKYSSAVLQPETRTSEWCRVCRRGSRRCYSQSGLGSSYSQCGPRLDVPDSWDSDFGDWIACRLAHQGKDDDTSRRIC